MNDLNKILHKRHKDKAHNSNKSFYFVQRTTAKT